MSDILCLPDDILIEIMLNLKHTYDYFAMLTTCQRLSKLKKRLAFIQESTKLKIKFSNLYEGLYSREFLTANGEESISATFYIDNVYDSDNLKHKFRFNNHNLHKIENLCKLAGNKIKFTKTKEVNNVYFERNPGNYLEVTYSWITDKILSAKVYNNSVGYTFYLLEKCGTNVDLSEYHDLYNKLYKGTKLEEFPGKLLLSALKKNTPAQNLDDKSHN